MVNLFLNCVILEKKGTVLKEPEINKDTESANEGEGKTEKTEPLVDTGGDEKERLTVELQELNDKYLRLYADFENYKKRVNKDKEELVKYGNERLLVELLPVLDNLEMALDHSKSELSEGLVKGVEITLREFLRTLEKFGLTPIEAVNKPFDPSVHDAMTIVEREDIEENIVVEEFRKGYLYKDKVIRAPLVAVSKRPIEEKEKEK